MVLQRCTKHWNNGRPICLHCDEVVEFTDRGKPKGRCSKCFQRHKKSNKACAKRGKSNSVVASQGESSTAVASHGESSDINMSHGDAIMSHGDSNDAIISHRKSSAVSMSHVESIYAASSSSSSSPVTSQSSSSSASSTGNGSSSNKDQNTNNVDDDDDDDIANFDFIVNKSNYEKIRTDVDDLAVRSVMVSCLRCPGEVPIRFWSKQLLQEWMCRHPYHQKDDVPLVKITHFRRYGNGDNIELLCTFRHPMAKGLKAQRRYWCHMPCLGRCRSYMLALKDHSINYEKLSGLYHDRVYVDTGTRYNSDEYDITNHGGEHYDVRRPLDPEDGRCPIGDDSSPYKCYDMKLLLRSRMKAME